MEMKLWLEELRRRKEERANLRPKKRISRPMEEYRKIQKQRSEERAKNKPLIVKPKRLSKGQLLQIEFNYLDARPWEELTAEEIKRWNFLEKKLKHSV